MPLPVRLRVVQPQAVTAAEHAAWLDLEARAIEANAYLSPHFVLPALRHLDPHGRAQLLFVERLGGSLPVLLAATVVVPGADRRFMPLPYLSAYQGRHTFLGGPLVDTEHASAALACLLQGLVAGRAHGLGACAGMLWPAMPVDGPLAAVLRQQVLARGLPWVVLGERERPVLSAGQAGDPAPPVARGKDAKEHARRWRRLQELGPVEWRAYRTELPPDVVEAFLDLEHCGWKGEQGSSLRASPADTAFFREMVAGFASQGRAFFTELRLGDQAIASTCNLTSGHEGFAFKVGWDVRHRRLGVGLLNELELVRRCASVCPDLQRIDSGADTDAFIAELWPQRRRLGNVFVPLSWAGRGVWALREAVRRAARGLNPRR